MSVAVIFNKGHSLKIRILIKNNSNINFVSHTKFCDTEFNTFKFFYSAHNPPYSHSEKTVERQ